MCWPKPPDDTSDDRTPLVVNRTGVVLSTRLGLARTACPMLPYLFVKNYIHFVNELRITL